ncbi:MAG: 2Fe-2S iron-sulfur cluster binding domain-containing protein [Bacteroidetes bacterium]|nr:2Fe-2S iron-sulfur cluster binding domain-containing protein [Bacteroidota bacterium]
MGLFDIFKKKEKETSKHGFHELNVSAIKRLNEKSVMVSLDVPSELKDDFRFIPGQYLNFELIIKGENYRRSYSICSGPNEPLSVAVKAVENGVVSNWFNQDLKVGDVLHVAAPEGNFTLNPDSKNIVAIAAGSGITPIMSISKALKDGNVQLFFGNRSKSEAIFLSEIQSMSNVKFTGFFSQEEAAGFHKGRIDKTNFTEIIKADLTILKADAFFICGPEGMIHDVKDTLKLFGINDKKIKFELFTAPTVVEQIPESDFKGTSQVTVILDNEKQTFDMKPGNATILDLVEKNGMDAPYSCRGGVCCSCKAKVLEGKATMRINYSLTDEEVKQGYILTCQAQPNSEKLTVTYDE